MATIQIPVQVLDENCAGCQSMSLDKTNYFADGYKVTSAYSCEHIHLCTYIRNRIVRKEGKATEENGDE